MMPSMTHTSRNAISWRGSPMANSVSTAASMRAIDAQSGLLVLSSTAPSARNRGTSRRGARWLTARFGGLRLHLRPQQADLGTELARFLAELADFGTGFLSEGFE